VAVVVGQYVGITALTAVGLAFSAAAGSLPERYVSLLGIAPVAIGVYRLVRRAVLEIEQASAATGVLTVMSVTVANGGDNLGVYIPLFAQQGLRNALVFAAVFAAMTGAWCLVSYSLVRHPTLGAPIRRFGPPLLPWVLIVIGLNILSGFVR